MLNKIHILAFVIYFTIISIINIIIYLHLITQFLTAVFIYRF